MLASSIALTPRGQVTASWPGNRVGSISSRSHRRLTGISASRGRLVTMIRTTALTALLLSLVGCGGGSSPASGSVDVWWRDGAGSDTGEACICEPVLLTMDVAEYGDAKVTAGWWSIVQVPAGASVSLSDTWAQETVATFDTPGWYTLDYTVEYRVGWTTYATSSRLHLYLMPTGVG